jgi:hypothetical protein
MVSNILLNKAMAVVAANHWIGKIDILDDRLQFAFVMLSYFAAKDRRDLVWLTDGPVGVEQAFAQLVECHAAMKDQVVAIFHLREEEPMLASSLFAFAVFEKRRETRQPFLPAGQQITSAEGVGQLLKLFGISAFQEGIRALLKINLFLLQAERQPMMLI